MSAQRKNRILVVLNYYWPYISGISEYARLVAEALSDDFEITILTGKHERELAGEELISGVRVIRANPLFFLHKGYISLDLIAKFRSLLRTHDLIHMHLPMLEAAVLAKMLPQNKPLLATFHCDLAAQASLFDRTAVFLARKSTRRALARANCTIVTSDDYASGSPLVKRHLDKSLALHPPCTEFFDNGHPIVRATPNSQHYRLGFLGRFVPEKGLDVLLKAIPPVLEKIPQARFVLAGERESVRGGSNYQSIAKLVEQHRSVLELPGPIPAESMLEFYSSLNALILPSVNAYEGFGMVQLEAMKLGIPVIASDRRGVRVAIQETGNGKLVPPGDAEALAAAIISLHDDTTFSPKEISQRAYQRFSNQAVFDGIRELYHSLCN